ncbi:hypothetical protein K439DRAFT_1639533 [Ramaria rubella]|nr:hypothetical protein K439DRAFT_1639533 [Ramaria rubella]
MSVTRFFAAKLRAEYAGDDDKSKKIRERLFQTHLSLYLSLPYVSNVRGVNGSQPLSVTQGYHYAILVVFESEEKIAYYNDEEPLHLAFKAQNKQYIENVFTWAFLD